MYQNFQTYLQDELSKIEDADCIKRTNYRFSSRQ